MSEWETDWTKASLEELQRICREQAARIKELEEQVARLALARIKEVAHAEEKMSDLSH